MLIPFIIFSSKSIISISYIHIAWDSCSSDGICNNGSSNIDRLMSGIRSAMEIVEVEIVVILNFFSASSRVVILLTVVIIMI